MNSGLFDTWPLYLRVGCNIASTTEHLSSLSAPAVYTAWTSLSNSKYSTSDGLLLCDPIKATTFARAALQVDFWTKFSKRRIFNNPPLLAVEIALLINLKDAGASICELSDIDTSVSSGIISR